MGNHPVLVAKGSLGTQNGAKWCLFPLQKEQKTCFGNGSGLNGKSGKLVMVRPPLVWNKSITTGTRESTQILGVMI